jgi:hypothetical protein
MDKLGSEIMLKVFIPVAFFFKWAVALPITLQG